MKTPKIKFKRSYFFLILASICIFASIVIIRKIMLLSSKPEGEKVCNFSDPVVSFKNIRYFKEIVNSPHFFQKGGTINDASCLNRTPIYGVVKVTSEEDIKDALVFAKENSLKVSIAGVRHSMGGHAFAPNTVVLDLTSYNKISVDENSKILTAQSGAIWHDIQNYLHPKGLAVKAMQSTDIFTVGGTIAINAHGMDHNVGAISTTIRSLRVMLPNGTIKEIQKSKDPELFNLVVGGYGLFGIILDAQIELTKNDIYERERDVISYKEFPKKFETIYKNNPEYGLMYTALSTAPHSLLKEAITYRYKKTTHTDVDVPLLGEAKAIGIKRFILNFSKTGTIGKELKWFLQKNIQPSIEQCYLSRSTAQREPEACYISRNVPMHDSVKYTKSNIPNDTDILQEYFVPRNKIVPFIDNLRNIIQKNDVTLLNATIRVVNKEDIVLNYAKEDVFAVVLYINHPVSQKGKEKMEKFTNQAINLALTHNGTFYLPYQLYYTKEQLIKAYPEIPQFFNLKKKYDPDELLTNTFYEKYK